MAANPKITELEQKYIELLEKKVARLEIEAGSKYGKPASPVSQRKLVAE